MARRRNGQPVRLAAGAGRSTATTGDWQRSSVGVMRGVTTGSNPAELRVIRDRMVKREKRAAYREARRAAGKSGG